MEAESRIKVAVRCRPLSQRERYDIKCVSRLDESAIVISNQGDPQERTESLPFQFDFFFDEDDNQFEVYTEGVLDLIDAALDGNNSTCLCYGQTGTGKTWTMLGQVDDAGGGELLKPGSGVFLRTLTDLFTYKARSAKKMHVTIMLSIVEIYMQEVRDLLGGRAPLRVRELGDECAMPELKIEEVNTVEDVYKFYKMADGCRSVTATKMNDVSSRSHAVFMIDLVQQVRTEQNPDPPSRQQVLKAIAKEPMKGGFPITASRVCLVDLAGSERIKKSGVDGKALEEAKAINKSLSALGKVINSLYEGQKHVSYRDSLLTRILKSCFADSQARVLLCANVSPTVKSFQETKSTLRFANQVKNIKASGSAHDATAELEFIERLRRMEEIAADIRIAGAAHDYEVQAMTRREGPPPPGTSRQHLIQRGVERYTQVMKEREDAKREKDAEEAKKVYEEIVERGRQEIAHAQAAMETQLEEADKAGAVVEAEFEQGKAAKEVVVKERTVEAKKIKKKRQEAEAKKEAKKKEVEAADEQLRQAEAELREEERKHEAEFGELRDEEREAAAAEEFQALHVANAKRVESYLRMLKERMSNLSDMRQAVEDVARAEAGEEPRPEGTSEGFCRSVTRWLVERSMRPDPTEYNGCPGTGRSFTHLTRPLLDYADWPHPPAVFEMEPQSPDDTEPVIPDDTVLSDWEDEPVPQAKANRVPPALQLPTNARAEKTNSAVPAEPAPAAAGGTGALRSVERRGSGGRMVTIGPGGAQGKAPALGQPVQYDFVSLRKKKAEEQRRREELEERRRRESQNVRMQQEHQRRAFERAQSEVTRYHDEEEADKHYLMGIYDADGLVQDILRYLQSGTYLVKHGRNGKPHRRKFWLTEGRQELCWTDDSTPESKRSSIALKDVTGIIMGQYSKVFKRQSQCGPAHEGFYNSFTVVVKQGKRTVDCVAETTSEFEAWLLGLANTLSLEPVWGAPLRLENLAPQDRQLDEQVVAEKQLSEREVSLALRHHVRPSHLLNVKRKIVDRRDDVLQHMRLFNNDMEKVYQHLGGIHPPSIDSRGSLLVTKGELRYHSGIDIFRTCVMWKLFQEQELLYDPYFRVPTYAAQSGAIGL
eukprot:TRINITY_DN4658_c5_g1_i1.p1 TRINITY_DN4658_c5_g1~~TRINITY_DN4658_c5_g1_i1.p1  ORF type:complete len:1130 (+),score=401.49 TRINITY_DN4658_c5_g1_i1:69-3392(+)